MNRLTAILLALMISVGVCVQAKEKQVQALNYTIEGVDQATAQGGQIVKVTIFTKNPKNVSANEIKEAAVRGVIFRDFQCMGSAGASMHTALCKTPNAEQQYNEFFDSFFKSGQCQSYVQCLDDTRRVIKSGKEYKVVCNVVVSEGMLRADLKKAGVLKDLSTGW